MAKRAVARRRYFSRSPRRHHKPKMTISLGILAGFAPTAAFAIKGWQGADGLSGIEGAAYHLTGRLTGYNWIQNKWYAAEMAKGWGPIILGALVHKMANRFGINRMISQAGIPVVRL
ncbi:MAG: hypothetical protein MUP14_04220 [Dehalococcoidia bacterium]|nr:hypothetical protein [Dehalococcoidia bacterium]